MAKINNVKFLKALKGTAGILSQIAKNMDVNRKSVWMYLSKHPELLPSIEQEREAILDTIEVSMIKKAVVEEDFKAQSFYLKTIGKHRGFTEKNETELTGTIDNKITFEIVSQIEAKNEKQIEKQTD